ncbi:hypothetical protein SSPO_001210 [Streptomyces antimycoticus]|uniref:HTH cro/C1-type domain-containing protein n=1 Tax=Streptomyces antimycoticus TaxID=68175 RepID=A0A499UA96_9ACTN|nr:hypothetical protein SSPO_001210 [Streptomyces antimycoticus]
MWHEAGVCKHCGALLKERKEQRRGRPAQYCGTACRQAAYRKRGKGAPEGVGVADEEMDQALRELAADAQAEVRHLVRLLSPENEASAIEAVRTVVRLRGQLEVLTAATVGRARNRKATWETIGRVLAVSPETARRLYREEAVDRRIRHVVHHYQPPQAESAGDAAPPPAPPPPAVSRRASSHLAPVLSQLQRHSKLPLRQLGMRTGVSASYLSRVLCGEKFPSWDLTERLARACGADPMVLRKVWEDEKLGQGSTASYSTTSMLEGNGGPAQIHDTLLDPLHSALRTLHRRAGQPSTRSIATVAEGLSLGQINRALGGTSVLNWPALCQFITALGGSPDYFYPLWKAAAHAAEHTSARLVPEPDSRSAEEASECERLPADRMSQLLGTFGAALSASPEVLFAGRGGYPGGEGGREQARADATARARLSRYLPRLGTA